MEGETDELGWQYSTDFASGLHRNCAILLVAIHSPGTEVLGNTGWLAYCASMSFVRRRHVPPSMFETAGGCLGGKALGWLADRDAVTKRTESDLFDEGGCDTATPKDLG